LHPPPPGPAAAAATIVVHAASSKNKHHPLLIVVDGLYANVWPKIKVYQKTSGRLYEMWTRKEETIKWKVHGVTGRAKIANKTARGERRRENRTRMMTNRGHWNSKRKLPGGRQACGQQHRAETNDGKTALKLQKRVEIGFQNCAILKSDIPRRNVPCDCNHGEAAKQNKNWNWKGKQETGEA
jgi:hypothetical protein